MVKITKVKNFKLELPTNKNATTTKPKDSSKDKDYSIKTVNQDQNTEELNIKKENLNAVLEGMKSVTTENRRNSIWSVSRFRHSSRWKNRICRSSRK